MTLSAVDKLSKEKIQQLLAAVGQRGGQSVDTDIEAVEYDWRQCQYFDLAQCQRLDEFAAQVADQCTQAFSRLFNRPYEISIVEASQNFAKDLFDPETESTDCRIAFGVRPDDAFGIITVTRPTALAWTGQLLGGGETSDEDRELSTLEESLLLDVAAGLTNAFSLAYPPADLSPAAAIACRTLPIVWSDDDELYRIVIEAKPQDSGSSSQAEFIVLCRQLEPIAGKDAAQQATLSPAEVEKAILEHIHDIPVAITAKLGTVKVDVGAIMGLEVDDILILDKKINEPVELLLNDNPFHHGRPAQAEGCYAVAIV